MIDPEERAGVVPDRPNHERGCGYRYGALGESGKFDCSCPHKDHPSMVVSAWPKDAERFLRGSMNQQYESTILCPDSEAGYTALHELVQEGWEPLFHWYDPKDEHNHMILRRSVLVSLPKTA